MFFKQLLQFVTAFLILTSIRYNTSPSYAWTLTQLCSESLTIYVATFLMTADATVQTPDRSQYSFSSFWVTSVVAFLSVAKFAQLPAAVFSEDVASMANTSNISIP
eukprot:TRINITY_DN439_c0_g1_i5.p4 TRINITY_DN439_c0_g1~~TRINITY_DN439_c0_g1_i5.p4  ORF type:complete len:106 (-),score=3.09 TRINITY_DN439_c0_g1_i5:251-568(-)